MSDNPSNIIKFPLCRHESNLNINTAHIGDFYVSVIRYSNNDAAFELYQSAEVTNFGFKPAQTFKVKMTEQEFNELGLLIEKARTIRSLTLTNK